MVVKRGMELDEDEEEWEDNYLPSSKTKTSGSNYQNRRPSRKSEEISDGLEGKLSDDMVTAHIRVALPELRGSLPKMSDLTHISVRMEEPVLCSMQWHMTSVETSVKPPPHPELPTLSIKGVDIGTDSGQSTKSSAANDAENEDENDDENGVGNNDSLGMSRVIDITRKHIGKYSRLPRSIEAKEKLNNMRHLEKPKPIIIESKGLPSKPAIDSPPSNASSQEATDNGTAKEKSALPPLVRNTKYIDEKRKEKQDKLIHGFANRSISMPNISSFPGGSGFASKLMDHDENEEMLKIKSRPRIVTPSQPIEAPMEQPLSVQFKDTGSFLSHLDDVLGVEGTVDTKSVIPNGLNASADNLIFEQAGGSRATEFSSSVSSLSINVSKIDDEMEGVPLNRKKSQKVVMAGKALVGGASNITAKKKKQRKAKTIDKTAWPFVDEE